ncbi:MULTISPECIES: hypothetical protein [unclassified Acinetobacter]|uniref:hypothetical protein n=1 Tax=unclassified Acinetobacter TaxID=196816 RepID=UPI0029343B81|nr:MULTISPECIES: hypothetical protein [unclassified Acinetobacter]WOE32646.1 hypothetical protein QSG84_05520 [Acinetobacter sp. SAAs470]WOE38122.1 hypothetical protein QSG86_14575 [Acinetobacter sp. SAAs474]
MQTFNPLEHSDPLIRNDLSFCQSSIEGLSTWATQLNHLALGHAAKALLQALNEISELNCEAILRFNLVQTLYPYYEQVVNRIEKYALQPALLSPQRQNHLIELLFLLRAKYIKIHFHIAQDCHQQRHTRRLAFYQFKSKKMLRIATILASYYALQQLSYLLYQQQRFCTTAVAQQWYIAHQLMYLAMQQHDQNININRLQNTAYPLHTIGQMYAHLILLSILNLHQLPNLDMHTVYLCSIDWAKLIAISHKETILSRYSIDADQDLPPIHDQQPNQKSNIFVVSHHLLQHLDQNNQQQYRTSAHEKVYLSPRLYFHIHHLLTQNTGRRYIRFTDHAMLNLYIGFDVAHHYLGHNTRHQRQFNRYFNHSQDMTHRSPFSTTRPKLVDIQHPLNVITAKAYRVSIIDRSIAGGYRIRWAGKKPAHIEVGEFILMQENQLNPCFAGLIRWIKSPADQHTEMGLELLAQHLAAAIVAIVDHEVRISEISYPAILIQNTIITPTYTTLIVPNHSIFKPQTQLWLHLGTALLRISLGTTVFITTNTIGFRIELESAQDKMILDQYLVP